MRAIKCAFEKIDYQASLISEFKVLGLKVFEKKLNHVEKLNVFSTDIFTTELPFCKVNLVNLPSREISTNNSDRNILWYDYQTDSIQYQLLELILAQKIALYRFSSQLKTFGGFNEDTIDGFGLKIVKPDDSYSWIEKQILKAITKNKSSKYPFSLAKKVIPDTIDFYFGDRMAYLHPHKTLAINFIQNIALEEEWLRY